jgi:hypothetical protein
MLGLLVPAVTRRSYFPLVRPELEVDIKIVIQHKLVVASGCESRPGSCQEAR